MREPEAFGSALKKRLEQMAPKLDAYIGPGEHHARFVRSLLTLVAVATLELRNAVGSSPAESLEQAKREIAALGEGFAAHPPGAALRASVLLVAVLDAAEKQVPRERAHQLIEWADREAWPVAATLAGCNWPGIGVIRIPGYFDQGARQADETPGPRLDTGFARRLWALRRQALAEGQKELTLEDIEAEVAARRGGALPH
jgi:hypothetical protein